MKKKTITSISSIADSDLCYYKGKVESSLSNIDHILNHDSKLAAIMFNLSSNQVEVHGEVPWYRPDPKNKEFTRGDNVALYKYFENKYDICMQGFIDTALDGLANSKTKAFNPIKAYFEGLTWDGKNRLDTLLIEILGAEDNIYTRESIRKTLVAAVTRVYNPGTKFDTMLILVGPQGIGKSTIWDALAGDLVAYKDEHLWFTDDLTMDSMKDKTAAEKIAGKLIVEVSEMTGMRKAEATTIKSFLSRREDYYRPPYARSPIKQRRCGIIVGTTNDVEGFLRDTTGNRRFWPVRVEGFDTNRVYTLTKEDIDQIWAEAVVRYKDGESLLLSEKAQAIADSFQKEYVETDERLGLVEDFLNRKITDNWYELSTFEHKDYLFRMPHLCNVEREYVCNMEIFQEALDGRCGYLDRKESYAIKRMMAKLPEWEFQGKAKRRFGVYGNQHYYKRNKLHD